MVLSKGGAEYSYTGIQEAWYLVREEQNTVTQVYRRRDTYQGSRIQLHRYTGGVVLSMGAKYSYTGKQGAWYSAGEHNTVIQVYRGSGTPQGSRIQ